MFIGGKINSHQILDYKELEYINKPFNDQDTLEKWKSLGHNYEKYTGLMRAYMVTRQRIYTDVHLNTKRFRDYYKRWSQTYS